MMRIDSKRKTILFLIFPPSLLEPDLQGIHTDKEADCGIDTDRIRLPEKRDRSTDEQLERIKIGEPVIRRKLKLMGNKACRASREEALEELVSETQIKVFVYPPCQVSHGTEAVIRLESADSECYGSADIQIRNPETELDGTFIIRIQCDCDIQKLKIQRKKTGCSENRHLYAGISGIFFKIIGCGMAERATESDGNRRSCGNRRKTKLRCYENCNQ